MKKMMAAGGIVLILVVAVVGFLIFNVNSIVKSGIEVVGSEVLDVPVTVDSVAISFLSGSGQIKGLKIGNPKGFDSSHAIAIAEVNVELDTASLTSDRILIKKVTIDAAEIIYEGSFKRSNIYQLQRNANTTVESLSSGTDESKADDGAGRALEIGLLQIKNSKIAVHMPILKKPLSLVLPVLELKDIGKETDTSAGEVIGEVFAALNKSLIPLITENTLNLSGQLKDVGEKISNKLKGLFK